MPSSASCTSVPRPGRPRRSRAANGATGCATGERRAEARGRRRGVRLRRRSESPRNARSSPCAAAAPIARALPYDARLAQPILRSRSSMRLPPRLASRLARSFTPLAAFALAAACASKPVEEKAVSPKATSAAPSAAAKAATAPPAAGKSGAAAPALRKAAIGDFGLDLSAGNRNLKPGDDFFAYASGGWYDSFTIPPDHSSYGPFDQLDELSKKRVRDIIEQAAAAHGGAGTPEQQIGDFYAAFMDEAAIEANGLAPAEADLKRIAAANTHEAIARLFGEPGFAPLFDVQLPPFAPGFPWQAFFEPQQLGAREDLVLGELSAIRDMAELFGRTSVPTLRAFLTFHYLSSHAAYLPKRFDEARFAFYGQTMRGQPKQRERWKRAVDAVD